MLPVIFEIPLPGGNRLPIHGYGLMIVLGFLLASWVTTREAKRRGLPDVIYDLGLAMLLSGLVGGRLFYYIDNYRSQYSSLPWYEFFKIWKGGLVFYGGAIFGALGGVIYCRAKRLPLADLLDVTAIGVPIGMAFGRLGCFLNGCCYGNLCPENYPFGVHFPAGSPAALEQLALGLLGEGAGQALAVHPAQLYQAAHDFLLSALLGTYLRRADAPRGGGIPLLFVLYAVGRFTLEGLRGDNPRTFTGLTLSQNLSLILFFGFGIVFLWTLIVSRKVVTSDP